MPSVWLGDGKLKKNIDMEAGYISTRVSLLTRISEGIANKKTNW